MSSKQAIAIAASICFILLIIFLFWGRNQDFRQAQDAFLEGKYDLAKEKLYEARNGLSPSEYFLYSAYILREQQKLKESSAFLKKAKENNQNPSSPLALEISLNQVLNSYLQHDGREMESALKNAQSIAENGNSWISFFKALEDYLNQNYKAACSIWKRVKRFTYMSQWMEHAFEKQFPPFWHSAHLFRCEIEEGDYLDAREALEKEIQTTAGKQLDDLYFLMGLSYAREAQQKPANAALSFYKQAFSYFNRIPIEEEPFFYEKKHIISDIQNDALKLIEMKSFQDLTFYVEVLEKWKAIPELNVLTAQLMQVLQQAILEKNWKAVEELTDVLNVALPQGKLRESLENQFEKLLINSLNSGELSQITLYWDAMRMFSSQPDALRKRISGILEQKITKLAPSDDSQLKATLPYIQFWKTIEQDHQRRYQFALELIELGNYLWENNHENTKSLALMAAASQLPYYNEQKLLHPKLEEIFNHLYVQALQEDQIDQLSSLLEAIKIFNLKTVPVGDQLQQGNLLADAQFLYNQKRYAEAEKKARWVYQLNPANPKAMELVGLLDYQNGNYQEALKLLKAVKSKKQAVEIAIAVSEYLAGNKEEGEKLLKNKESGSALDTEAYLKLGYGLLSKGDAKGSLYWFEKIAPKDNDVYAGEAFAAYEMQQWQKAIDFFHQLTPPYSHLDALQGLAIKSFEATGNNTVAEEILNNMLKQKNPPVEEEFPYPFRVFKRKLLDPIQREAIAGEFYLKVKKDPIMALSFFSKSATPSPETLLVKAEIMLSLKDIPQALANIGMAAEKSQGLENVDAIRKKALPLMGSIYARTGYIPEAVKIYQQFYLIDPQNMSERSEYADVWMKAGRYDLALNEYQLLKKAKLLGPEDEIKLIECKIHLNQFEEANDQAKKWLDKTPSPPLLDQLNIARLMIISKNSELFTQILKKIPDFNRRSLKENIAMINIWIDLGEYEKASALTQRIKDGLEKSSEGLMTLARLDYQLSNVAQAISEAEQSLRIDPSNLEAQDFINHNAGLDFQEKRMVELNAKLDKDQNSLSLKMDLADSLIHVFLLQKKDQKNASLLKKSDLGKHLAILQDASKKNPEFPRIYVLEGIIYSLLENPEDAVKVLQNAVQLNPSDVEANKYLALSFASMKNYQNAFYAIMQALKYSPNDADLWEIIAKINAVQGNNIDAINYLLNAIKFKPNEPLPYMELGALYLDVKNLESAESMLEKAVSLSPSNVEALKILYMILEDPDFLYAQEKEGVLEEKRRNVLEKIKKLDPKAAENLIH